MNRQSFADRLISLARTQHKLAYETTDERERERLLSEMAFYHAWGIRELKSIKTDEVENETL